MSKEQCVICIDNSEYMRNGDYTPTRMEAQIDTANLLCGSKTEIHPETTVAIMTTAGNSPNVRLGLTTDFGKMMATLASIEVEGEAKFAASLRVAKLVLKRYSGDGTPNRRVVAFVGSPLTESKDELQKLGAELKKTNIAVDVVNFGEVETNTEKLEAFIAAVDKDENSRLVTVPPGPHILSDMLLQSPIFHGGRAGAGDGGVGAGAGAAVGDAGDADQFAEMDPELAEVMRLSLQEYEREQARRRAESEGTDQAASTEQAAGEQQSQSTAAAAAADVEFDEDEELRLALELSRQEAQQQQQQQQTSSATEQAHDMNVDDMDEDEMLRLALELSKQEAAAAAAKSSSPQTGDSAAAAASSSSTTSSASQKEEQKDEDIQDIMKDEDYLDSVLESLPGVNKDELKKQNKDGGEEDKE